MNSDSVMKVMAELRDAAKQSALWQSLGDELPISPDVLNGWADRLARLLAAADALAEAGCKLRESSGFIRTDALRDFRTAYHAYKEARDGK